MRKIINFSLYVLVCLLFWNIVKLWFVALYYHAWRFKTKNGKHTSIVNYLKAHKPVCFLHSYFLSVTQQYKHRKTKSTSAIHPAITENMKDLLVKCTLHISMCKSHSASISAMLNTFYNILAIRSVLVIFISRTEAITH